MICYLVLLLTLPLATAIIFPLSLNPSFPHKTLISSINTTMIPQNRGQSRQLPRVGQSCPVRTVTFLGFTTCLLSPLQFLPCGANLEMDVFLIRPTKTCTRKEPTTIVILQAAVMAAVGGATLNADNTTAGKHLFFTDT